MVGFALPSVDKVVSDNVFGLGAIAHEFVHCSPFADIVFESVYKFTVCFDTIGINNKTLCAHKDLGTRRTVINSRCVSEDGIRCYGLIPTVDVEGRETLRSG